MASELFKFVVFRAPRPDSFERNSDKFIRPPGEAQYQLLSKIELPNGKSAVFVSKELPSTAPKTPSAEKIVVFSNLCEILWPSGSKRDLSAAVELAKNIEILDLETTARLWDQYIWHVLQHNPKVEKYERYIRALEVVRRAHRTELTESECEQILEMRISILSENRRVKGVHAGQPKNWNQSDFNAKLKKRNEAIASLWEIQAARQEINRAFPSIVTFEISKPDKVNQSRSKKDFEKDDDAAMLHPVVSLTEVKLSEKTRAILAKAGLKSSATLEEVNTRLSRLGNRLEIIALPPPPPPREPTVSEYCEFCNVRLGGIADFRRVDQELVRYEAEEIAHVENVLQGQYKERKTRRLDRTEDTLFSSSETETTKERDVQTTSKNELQQQAKEVIDKEQKLEAGVKVSATYGPVSVEASFGYGSTMSQNQTNEKSLTIAKSITDRALERVVNKVHEERTSRKISEFEEINTHGLDNRGGTGHVVGVYRWLTKVYRAKLVSYGLRDSIECIIENPAEFLRPKAGGTELENTGWWALDSQNHKDVSLKTPLKTAGDLDENNYVYYSSYYGVELEPPPQMILTLAKAYGEGSVPNEVLATPNNDVMIPEGYYALYAYVRGGFHQPPGFPGNVTVFIGNQTFGLGAASGYLIPNLYNNVGVSLVGWTRGYSLEVTFWCVRTTAHFESWQLKSYKRLKDAYNAKLMQLEQAAQNANGIIGSMGTNPSRNVEIIEQELKKCVISALLCNQAFWLGCEKRVVECSCSSTGDSVPLPGHHKRTCEIGHLATFIESVIDWKLMVYELYSYFYANTCEWKTLKSFAADDPLFEKFLQAGLARVVVPLAVGKEQDFYHFYTTGQVWKLFTPPPILGGYEDQTIASDVLDSQHNPITWEVRVPTSLVILECGSGCVSNPGPTDPSYPYFAPIIGSHEGGSLVGGSGKEEDGGKEEPHVH